jgi:putative colanic acid biosynthesis acetyltransferase WcaF
MEGLTPGSPASFDISANRLAKKWSAIDQVRRSLWTVAWPLFRFSPRPLWSWRVFLLRLFGAAIDHDVHIHPTVCIEIPWNLQIGRYAAIGDRAIIYNLGMVKIGSATTISQGAHLCAGTHDYRRREFPLIKAPISVGKNVWICADAFVGPGVEVGDHAIVGARAVVMRNVVVGSIVAGNPAVVVKNRTVMTTDGQENGTPASSSS